MKRVLYIECFSGVAGDMLLGALIDAGLPESALRAALGGLGVDHELRISKVVRAGVSATKVDVVPKADLAETPHLHADGQPHSHPHAGDNGHRSLADITHLIDHADLTPSVRRRAVELVTRMAEVEAEIHNMPVGKVHLHEVGAVDSIIDIVGCVFGLDWFGADLVIASPLNVGAGQVRIAHGTFPVPAPATMKLVSGIPVYAEGPAVELTTPTGALLVAGHASGFGTMPSMVAESIGYGAGTKDFTDRPNVVRIVVGHEYHLNSSPVGAAGEVVKIECEIDDMNPQLFGPVMDDLLELGALDVFLTPVQMKKQRPGTLVTILAPPAKREMLTAVMFDHTTTIGVRYSSMLRDTLERHFVPLATPLGEIRIKVASRDGHVLNASPEFDDCIRAARASGLPVKQVQAQAMKMWLSGEGRQPVVSERRKVRRRSPSPASRSGRAVPRGRSGLRGKK